MAIGGVLNEVWMFSATRMPKRVGSIWKVFKQRQEDRHEDDDDLGPFQRPAEQEDDDLREDQEAGRAQIRAPAPNARSLRGRRDTENTDEKVHEPMNR